MKYSHSMKFFAIMLRIAVWLFFMYYKSLHGLSFGEFGSILFSYLKTNPYSPILFITFYILRIFLFFPPEILTFMWGVLYGPMRWSLYVWVAEVLSSQQWWLIWRRIWWSFLGKTTHWILEKIKRIVLHEPCWGTLLLRLLPIQFDVVNYVCGFIHVNWFSYSIATLPGLLPSVLPLVFVWSSFYNQTVDFANISINHSYFFVSVILYVFSFGLAYFLHRSVNKRIFNIHLY